MGGVGVEMRSQVEGWEIMEKPIQGAVLSQVISDLIFGHGAVIRITYTFCLLYDTFCICYRAFSRYPLRTLISVEENDLGIHDLFGAPTH